MAFLPFEEFFDRVEPIFCGIFYKIQSFLIRKRTTHSNVEQCNLWNSFIIMKYCSHKFSEKYKFSEQIVLMCLTSVYVSGTTAERPKKNDSRMLRK